MKHLGYFIRIEIKPILRSKHSFKFLTCWIFVIKDMQSLIDALFYSILNIKVTILTKLTVSNFIMGELQILGYT